MNERFGDYTSPAFWYGVVGFTILLHVVAFYATRLLNAGGARSWAWWRKRSAKAAAKDAVIVAKIKDDQREYAFVIAAEMRYWFLSIFLILTTNIFFAMSTVLKFGHIDGPLAGFQSITRTILFVGSLFALIFAAVFFEKALWCYRLLLDARRASEEQNSASASKVGSSTGSK